MSVTVYKANVDVGTKTLTAEGTIFTSMDNCWSWRAKKVGNEPLVFTSGEIMYARDLQKHVETAVLAYLDRNIPALAEAFK